MAASLKTALIGIFVLVAIAVIVFMLLFLHPSVGDNAKTLHVRFTNIDKVNVGTRVTYAGRPMGEVVEIKELPDARTARVAVNGQIYVYELTLKVDTGVNVFNTDTITLRTSGLLGERNIDVNPEPVKPGQELYLVNDEILYAVPAASVEDTLKQFEELSKYVKVVFKDIHKSMVTLRNEKIIENIGATAKNAAEITASFNQPEKLNRFINDIVQFTDSLNETWKTVDKTVDEFHTSSINFKDMTVDGKDAVKTALATLEDVKKVTETVSRGEGSVGRLFMKDDIYLKVKSILSKGDNLVSDISKYGLLFQNNKQWQRISARRQQMLQRLSNPEIFSNHFDNEMYQINDSLSNVTQMLNETPYYPQSLYGDDDFKQRFADLMRKVGNMEDTLKMYNQQVADLSPTWQYTKEE